MAELKTKPTKVSVAGYLAAIKNDARRQDCEAVVKMMTRVTKEKPVMWGPSIIGFGDYHYKYASGRENDWFMTGFSPRVQNITLYSMGGFDSELLKKLGKYKTGKGCLYIGKLEDVDKTVLADLIKKSVKKLSKS